MLTPEPPEPHELPELPEPPEPLVLHPATNRKGMEWLAVLGAAAIPFQVDAAMAWEIRVPPEFAERARQQIDAFEAESLHWPPKPATDPLDDDRFGIVAVFMALALWVLFMYSGPDEAGHLWFARGSADSAAIFDGEWWRIVTALTLHSDFSHVVSNAVCCCVLVPVLCVYIGDGAAAFFTILLGALGNLLTAWFYESMHHSIGFSTSVFAVIGALGTIRAVHYFRNDRRPTKRVLLPLAAVLCILGFLSGGPRTDVMAHLFGALCGVIGGVCLAWLEPCREHGLWQTFALVTTVVLVAASWFLALA